MLTIKVKADLSGLKSLIENFSERRLATTTAIALTRTAQIAQQETIREIRTSFDRPTPYALNATRLIPATKDKLAAYVWLKDRHGRPAEKESSYFVPEVFGGRRGRKAYETALMGAGLRSNEFTVPAQGLPLDPYGNVPSGVIKQILSQLRVASKFAGSNQNRTNSVRSRRSVAKAGTFFIPLPGSDLPRGVYQRVRTGFGWSTRMVLKIVVGKPQYRQRLPLGQIGERVVAREFQQQFDRAVLESNARLQAR